MKQRIIYPPSNPLEATLFDAAALRRERMLDLSEIMRQVKHAHWNLDLLREIDSLHVELRLLRDSWTHCLKLNAAGSYLG